MEKTDARTGAPFARGLRKGPALVVVVAVVALVAALLSGALLAAAAGTAGASEARDGEAALRERLLRASEGLQMPGSEADSGWWFVSYPGEEELPTAERMAYLTGCSDHPEGGMARSDFDTTFASLGTVQPWMDPGQKESARGFRKLGRLFHRKYGDNLAAYRCETGTAEVHIYFVGANKNALSGLKTTNIET